MYPALVRRDQWKAFPPRWTNRLVHPVPNIFSTYVRGINPCYELKKCIKDVRFIQFECTKNHRAPDIVYNFMISAEGVVYEGRGWMLVPGLPNRYKDYSEFSIFIGLMGRFRDRSPPKVMFQTRDELIQYGVTHKYIAPKVQEFMIVS